MRRALLLVMVLGYRPVVAPVTQPSVQPPAQVADHDDGALERFVAAHKPSRLDEVVRVAADDVDRGAVGVAVDPRDPNAFYVTEFFRR